MLINAREICPKKKTLVLTNVGKRAVGGEVLHTRRICGFEKFRIISSEYLKISKIKKSPQFGWVKKHQRTAGFQTVRGGYLFFFFQNTFENHRDI